MRKIVVALLLLALHAVAHAQTWNSAGVLTNPAVNTIMADSGAQNEGLRHWSVLCSSSVAAVLVVEHRDGTNTVNVTGHSQAFVLAAMNTAELTPAAGLFFLQDERIRIRLNAAVTGTAQCSVFVE